MLASSQVVHSPPSEVFEQVECLPRRELRDLQLRRLAELLPRAGRTALYRDRLSLAEGAVANAIAEGDLTGLPLTTKDDLRALHSLEDALAVPREYVQRWHCSSGTSGKRTAMAYSRADLDLWARLTARALAASGIRRGTRVHNAYGYGLFTGGLGFGAGLQLLEASVVPASGTPSLQEHLELIDWFGAQALLCTPSCAASLVETLGESGKSADDLQLSVGVFGGEGWSKVLGARIEQGLGLTAFDTYGLSEVIGPGVAHACHYQRGLHFYEDAFLVELLEPGESVPVPPGQLGELVLTTLMNEACPRVRYRTGDLVRLEGGSCECGRTGVRLVEFVGRVGDCLDEAGLMPLAVERALLAQPDLSSSWCIQIPEGSRSEPIVHAEVRDELDNQERDALAARIARALQVALEDSAPRVRLHPAGTLPRSVGKAERVIAYDPCS